MKWCKKFTEWRRSRRGEVTIKDNLLTIENGGKDSLEYKDRKTLVSAINKLLPRVYQERNATTLLRTEMIKPVKSIRRPRKLPFVHHIPGLAIVKISDREVEAAVLEFKYADRTIKCACTEDGKSYRYYKLYSGDGVHQQEFWMPIYDIRKSNVPSSILRAVKRRLERIVPPVS